MSSITIHNMDDLLAASLKQRAAEGGGSLNSTIKDLLSSALGLNGSDGVSQPPRGYRRFLGLWQEAEKQAFDKAVEDFGRIDPGDWQG